MYEYMSMRVRSEAAGPAECAIGAKPLVSFSLRPSACRAGMTIPAPEQELPTVPSMPGPNTPHASASVAAAAAAAAAVAAGHGQKRGRGAAAEGGSRRRRRGHSPALPPLPPGRIQEIAAELASGPAAEEVARQCAAGGASTSPGYLIGLALALRVGQEATAIAAEQAAADGAVAAADCA